MIYLSVLALVFLVRELDETVLTVFGSTYLFRSKKLVDFLLVCMGLWAFGWREKLFDCLNRSRILKVSFFGVLWTYLFSQLIARRVFRGIFPDESLLHIPMEETVETFSHLFFLVFALFCFLFISNTKHNSLKKEK
jgi:UDP-N-acetylmuramyl pentapeptide phosphotransferase/UDP-N-acetylglucosamine-1-phosphate transferase